jgi:UDP-N-acetylglucosamine/UDP-N-acetylgalactosamine diphosphorylase
LHRAEKKIACVDDAGQVVHPAKPNGVKLEAFVFDALPLAQQTIVVEAWRDDEFGPVKNATGVDSVESSRRLLQERFARWLRSRGIDLPRGADGQLACTVEISPRQFVTQNDFQHAEPLEASRFVPGATVVIP